MVPSPSAAVPATVSVARISTSTAKNMRLTTKSTILCQSIITYDFNCFQITDQLSELLLMHHDNMCRCGITTKNKNNNIN